MSEYDTGSITEKDQAEAVRRRPGLYFGDINSYAANRVVYEIVANAIDQYLAGSSTKVGVELEGELVRINDDGAGMPFTKPSPNEGESSIVEHYLLNFHNTPTADQHAPHVHFKTLGLGLLPVNAVCKELRILSNDGQQQFEQSFSRGKVQSQGTLTKSNSHSGTTIELVLDPEIFGDYRPDDSMLRKTLFELAHFYPGLIVEFQKERFFAEKGLLDLAQIHYAEASIKHFGKLPEKFHFEGMFRRVQIVVAAIGEVEECKDTHFVSWVNGSRTVLGGIHIESLQDAFAEAMWTPSIALIHVIMHKPRFAGPSKDALISTDVAEVIKVLLKGPLSEVNLSE